MPATRAHGSKIAGGNTLGSENPRLLTGPRAPPRCNSTIVETKNACSSTMFVGCLRVTLAVCLVRSTYCSIAFACNFQLNSQGSRSARGLPNKPRSQAASLPRNVCLGVYRAEGRLSISIARRCLSNFAHSRSRAFCDLLCSSTRGTTTWMVGWQGTSMTFTYNSYRIVLCTMLPEGKEKTSFLLQNKKNDNQLLVLCVS